MAGSVYAGHAGELAGSTMLPHELVGLVALLSLLVIVLAVLAGATAWRLRRIERRLRALEQTSTVVRQKSASITPRS